MTTAGQTYSTRLDGWLGSPEATLSTEPIRQDSWPYLEMMLESETAEQVAEVVLNRDKQRDILELMDILTRRRVGSRG